MNDSNSAQPETANLISGFWRRIWAHVIDLMLLAVVCSVIGLLFYDKLTSVGSYGRLIGWFLALNYFTPLNSELGKGQTIGKRIQKIRVVDRKGKFIGVGRSFIRALVLTTPFLLNGFLVPYLHPSLPMHVLGFLFSVAVFGGITAIIYLYIFNRKTRQSLHDLVVGTFVINAVTQPAVIEVRTGRIHKIVAGALFALPAVAPLENVFLTSKGADALPSSPLMAVSTSVQSMPEVFSAGVMDLTLSTHFLTGDKAGKQQSNEMIVVSVTLKHQPDSFEREAARIAERVLQQPDVLGGKPLRINLTLGIDLGLAFWHKQYQYVHTAEEWKEEAAKLQ
jgi:uncharacterized RDD family membrane protein YckC